jgi:hypothetical protein
VTFFPDGETHIPNQTPVPGVREGQVPPDRPNLDGAVAAVLLAYVFPVTDDPTAQTGIVVAAAVLCSIHSTAVVMSQQRRRQAQVAAVAGRQGSPAVTDARPYGTVPTTAPSAPIGGFSLTVEDVFTITGRGTVVTGRVASGRLHEGQTAVIQRDGVAQAEVEVAGIEMFRKTTQTAEVGDNVGLLLRGVTRDDVRRGDVVAA